MKKRHIILMLLLIYMIWNSYTYFTKIGEFNEDYWFEGNTIRTDNGQIFNVERVSPCNIEGVVLATKTYSRHDFPSGPENIFSPLDIFIGIGDVMENPDKYEYSVSYYRGRYIAWRYGGSSSNNYYYFKNHVGNLHIIPHNREVYEALFTIKKSDSIIIKGSFVNINRNSGNGYKWKTDTEIGNFQCEIVLVDEITINGHRYGA